MRRIPKVVRILEKLRFNKRKPKIVEVEGPQLVAIVAPELPDQCLAIAWDEDDAGYGFWRIQHIGVTNKKVVTKELKPGEAAPAFYGDVAVKGAGSNDLHTGFGYEDEDILDREGQVVNKPLEINVFPVRKR